MKIKDIMTKHVLILKPTTSLYASIQKFAKKDVSGAPVINGGGHVVGVVSDADITRALDSVTPSVKLTSSKMFSLVFASLRNKKDEDKLRAELAVAKKVKVNSFMSKPLVINQSASIMDAIKDMVSNDINRLPVIDNKNRLVGIIARTDIIKALSKKFCK